ncbi:MAG: NFACT family protein [Chloroflexi bacterium]|nr:NFACT family protein [Chloroflexota bacterium]
MIDALTIRALGAELNGTIAGGRVQNVYFVAPLVIGVEVYVNHARHYLLASAEPQTARLLLVAEKLRSASVPLTPFLLLLKKYAQGAFIQRVVVVPRERILRIEFDSREQGVSTLVVELMSTRASNRANLILLDAGGIILDAIHRVPATVNRARVLEPRAKYVPPPPQGKADPLAVSVAELEKILERAIGETLAERLVQSVAGASPVLARELAFRVAGAADALYSSAYVTKLHAELTRVWLGPAEPSLAWRDTQPTAVAAFLLTHLPNVENIPTMSAALEKFYGAAESYEAVKAPLRAPMENALEKLRRKLASLQRELVPLEEIENLKLKGEMILGYQYALAPGQTELRAEVTEELTLDIALDPQLSPLENANRYFDQYKRARDARARVPERIAEVENEIAYAEQILNDLDGAESRAEIDQVLDEAREAQLLIEMKLRNSGRAPRSEARQFTSPDGLQILVGRNARQNDALTFERAKADDVWLHARGHAGSHVVILSNGAPVPETTLEFAASLAAYYSQARREGAVDVIYAPRKNVHRVRGAGAHPGLVTVKEEKVVRVKPQPAPE